MMKYGEIFNSNWQKPWIFQHMTCEINLAVKKKKKYSSNICCVSILKTLVLTYDEAAFLPGRSSFLRGLALQNIMNVCKIKEKSVSHEIAIASSLYLTSAALMPFHFTRISLWIILFFIYFAKKWILVHYSFYN